MSVSSDKKPTPRAIDKQRVEMLRRHKAMSVSERVALFERLSRDAAWATQARRVR